jgi:predicted thioesterase
MTYTETLTVQPHMTAQAMKSGALAVFATPYLLAGMENVCLECVVAALDPGFSTVGTGVNIRHLAPTPVGMDVTFTCTLVEIDRRRLAFRVEARDAEGLIGEGTHERFIVDSARHEAKAQAKLDAFSTSL